MLDIPQTVLFSIDTIRGLLECFCSGVCLKYGVLGRIFPRRTEKTARSFAARSKIEATQPS